MSLLFVLIFRFFILFYFISFFFFSGMNFTWVCRPSSENFTSDLLEISSPLPSSSQVNLDRGGCYGTGAGKIGSGVSLLKINSGYMAENSSYLITVVVRKDRRQAMYTQEVAIVPGDPPEVLIRWGERRKIDLFTDTAAILNKFDLRSIIGCPGGMSTFRSYFARFSGHFFLKFS